MYIPRCPVCNSAMVYDCEWEKHQCPRCELSFDDDEIVWTNEPKPIDQQAARIAALEAQNARLLALVREVADNPPRIMDTSWQRGFCFYCSHKTPNHDSECIIRRMGALLAELEGGDNG